MKKLLAAVLLVALVALALRLGLGRGALDRARALLGAPLPAEAPPDAALALGSRAAGDAAASGLSGPRPAPLPRPPARYAIPYKISARLWDPGRQASIPTPPAIIEKIRLAFALWSSVPEAGLALRYAGLAAPSYASFEAVPADGAIYVVLDTQHPFRNPLEAASGGYRGELPGRYRKGAVLLNTRAHLAGLSFKTLVHEIGHALGIRRHSATIGAVMSCGTPAWSGHDFLALSEQDRADLLRVWNPAAVYAIAGQVRTTGRRFVYVYAVDVRDGRTFSALSDQQGRFEIALLRPGRYRLFAKSLEAVDYDRRAAQQPSFYVDQGQSTADPLAGKVLALTATERRIEGLALAMIDRPAPFNLFWSRVFATRDGSDFVHSFLRPGHAVRFNLTQNAGAISALEPYGTDPDYRFSELTKVSANGTYMVTVSADRDAAPGHRLVLARGPEGVQAGLVGVHVIGRLLPPRATAPVAQQLAGAQDFSRMLPDYWRR